jgi:hypothetical protein
LVVIAVAYLGYTWWDDWSTRSREAELDRAARVTAQVWVATAVYAGNEEAFLVYRDSLLDSEGLTRDDLFKFLDRYKNQQEPFLDFSQRVRHYVDSMAAAAEEARRERFDRATDTVQARTAPVPDSGSSGG